MVEFRNESMKKARKRKNRNLLICILVIIIGIVCFLTSVEVDKKVDSEKQDMNTLILSAEREDKKAYLSVAEIPFAFAEDNDGINRYYIVTDGQYLYITYMSPAKFEELNKEDIIQNPIEIEGITKQIPSDIKGFALDAYNEGLEEEYQISEEDFNKYFGDIYLDTTLEYTEMSSMLVLLGLIISLIGIIAFIIVLIEKLSFSSTMQKMEIDEIEKLDDEMNDSSAFYYEKADLCLTNNFVVNFGGKFTILEYKDIVWMYVQERRTNGIKTSKSIKAMTKDGKVHTIATIEFITKAKKETFDEIWNTICVKNPNVAIGYTKENIKQMKELYGRKKNKKELL